MTATELYNELNKIIKSPGQWLALKTTKEFIKEAGATYDKDNDEYLFDDALMGEYKAYIKKGLAGLKGETKPVEQKHWTEIVYDNSLKQLGEDNLKYILTRAYETILNKSMSALRKDFSVVDPWSESAPRLKETIATFLCVATNEIKTHNHRIDKIYLDRIVNKNRETLSPHLALSEDKTLFISGDSKVIINIKNNIVKVAA